MIVAVSIFAMFALNEKTPINGLELNVIAEPEDIYKDILRIFYIENDGSRTESIRERMLPGECLNFEITVTNNTGVDMRYRLKYSSIISNYPNFSSTRDYSPFICDLYEIVGNSENEYTPFTEEMDAAAKKQTASDVLKAMAEPVTNAVYFYYGDVEKSSAELINPDGTMKEEAAMIPLSVEEEFSGANKKTICTDASLRHYPDGIPDEETWINIPYDEENEANNTIKVYLTLYLDPYAETVGSYDGKSLVLKNSNGFLCQNIAIIFGLNKEEI